MQPGSVHILLGYADGSFTAHLVPDAMVLAPGADPARTGPSLTDLAVLHVARPVPYHLPLLSSATEPGTALLLAGYNQDRSERLRVDQTCRVQGTVRVGGEGPFLLHDCAGTRGGSGGPLLVGSPIAGYRVAGIQDAALPGRGGVAIPAEAVAALLP